MKTFLILIFLTTIFCATSFAQCLNVTSSSNDVNCFGGNDGTITLTPTSGQAPYTYTWSGGTITLSTGHTITGLSVGIYNVTVEDNLGCDMNTNLIINGPSSPVSTTTSITSNYNGADVSCFSSCDGSGLVTVSGGTGAYSYVWADGSTTAAIIGICPGVYHVTVTDANNCSAIDSLIITAPSNVTATISSNTNVACNGDCTGTATVTASGGVSTGYTYSWSNGETTATASNLCAGIYCPTITDINGCTATTCLTITESSPMTGTINIDAGIACNAAPTGQLTAVVQGGTPSVMGGYTYVWSIGGAATATISNLAVANYCVTVTDSLGCSWTSCENLYDPSVNISTINGTNVSCNGLCDGSFSLVATGGSAPFTYSVDGGLTFTATSTYSNLCAGLYYVQVKNSDNCVAIDSIVIASPSPITAQIIVQDTICQGSAASGNLLGLVTGGTPSYTYAWSHGTVNNPTAYSTAGNYCLYVSDANGCTATTCTFVDTLNFEVNITSGTIVGNQRRGISYPSNPQPIYTRSSYPNETTYDWSPAIGLSCTNCPNPIVSITTPTQYVLNTNHNSLGCTSSDTITIYPHVVDTIRLDLAPDSSITHCFNYSLPFTTATSSALSYGSITYGLPGCFEYTSNGTTQEGVDTLISIHSSIFSDTISTFPLIVVYFTITDTIVIYITTSSCVWSGDTNDDGIANNFDLLPIGQHHGTTGLTRTNASINYTCQPARNWGATILGMPSVDLKHVDTDGNATINSADTNAIILNWTQTHLRSSNNFLTGIDLYVDTMTTSPGDTVRLPIILGNTVVPNGYGIAFTINYASTGIDTGTVSIDFNNSWLGTINNDMIGIHKDFYDQGQTEVALSRIDQTAVSGSGAIAHINFTIKDDVLPKSAFVRLDFDITNIRFIDPLGTMIPVTGVPTQILVTDGFTSTETLLSKAENALTVFPNPTTGQIQIQSLVEEIETILIYNLTGTLLHQEENINTLNTTLDLKRLPSGIYIANVISEKGMQSVRIIKK